MLSKENIRDIQSEKLIRAQRDIASESSVKRLDI